MSSHDTLPQIGAHCSLPSCSLNDFLPIRCTCHQLFCKDHISPDVHHCPSLQAAPSTIGSALKLQRCAAQSCNKPSLESFVADPSDTTNRSPALCSGCKQAFCAEHRDPSSHSCAPFHDADSGHVPEKNAAAKALLAKHFGTDAANATAHAGSSAPKPSSRKEAQQRQLAVIKMRVKAQPGNPKDTPASVPMNQRLHVRVSPAGVPSSERIFWFPKTIGTGKALDLLAAQFKLTISDSQPLKLLLRQSDHEVNTLRTDQLLADQVPDGACLHLVR
ncbi:hypothetical protein BD309DRAFT_887464 [Dichomitus squalens]|uniref:Uncharacterized protein n=1 Tax=Dichomitus squalens TaxID=114155 RepID=A0A4Q9Q2C1_9APHY|nr:hypothetical protein BD309DRAFT_887464 [Dichomitus squalens]TBU60724.1 hypothetical protein BD310DRAFT_847348 [Dichomitus squalens]